MICVVGGKEAEANALSVRLYGGQELGSIPVQVGKGAGGRGGKKTQGKEREEQGVYLGCNPVQVQSERGATGC